MEGEENLCVGGLAGALNGNLGLEGVGVVGDGLKGGVVGIDISGGGLEGGKGALDLGLWKCGKRALLTGVN